MKKTFLLLLFALGISVWGWGQTSSQDFGTGTGSHTSQTGSTSFLPNPTSGTTWARAGATAPNAPIVLANTSNPLGTTGSYVRAVASSSTSVSKFSPWVGYTGSTEFYTSFKVLFGDASAGSTATSGSWTYYQGAGAMYSDANDFAGAQVFTGLRFTFGASGVLALTYRGGSSWVNTGLSPNTLSSATVYTIEIVGNNKTSGTINYTYNGIAQTVAVQKFDLYVNGSKIGDDLDRAALPANTAITSGTFIGISSTSNAANIFVDDAITYNAVPASIGSGSLTPPTLTAAPGATVDDAFDVTFTDDATWRAAITSITVGGTTLVAGSSITAGTITFTPSASSPANLLQTSGSKEIVVIATGYSNATVTQSIGAGAPNKLAVITQPGAPASNGAVLGTQPVVAIRDQYGNATTSTATVSAAVGAGTWSIGGTTNKDGVSGTATFTDLTATSAAAVIGATISFTSSGLTGATSNGFDIPGPPDPEPTNHATDFTATTNSHNQITLTWTDATGTQLPHAYLVKAAVAPATPTGPADGVAEGEGTLVKNINFGIEEAVFTGLEAGTTYNFAIWPYTNSGSSIDYKIGGQPTAVAQTEELPYIVNFEGSGETKTGYTSGTVTLSGIDWNMTEALIGTDPADWKNGARSARMRGYGTSSMTMLENKPNGIGTISFSYRRYVTDGQVDWKVEYSIDAGMNWTQVGSAFTAPASDVVQTFSETVNVPGNVRIRIKRATESGASNQRLNIDDIAITDYEVATFTGTGAWTETARWSTGQVPGSSDEVLIHGSCSVAGAVTIGTVYVGYGYSLEIGASGALTITGTLTNNGSLTIKSDATGTGSLIHYTAGVNATVERYLSGSSEAWHLLSSPVTGQAISGSWTPAGSYPDGSGYDIYVYDEASNTYVNRKNTIANPIGDGPRFDEPSINGSLNFVTGKGYMVAFEAVGSAKSFTGTLNEGIIYMPLLSKVGTSIYAGSNLVGNPYPSSIDWKSLMGVDFTGVRTETGGGKQFYIWNQTANNFGVYNSENAGDDGTNGASRYIAPMQGFWVAAATNGGELGFDNDARVHSSQAWLKASTATNPSLVIRTTAPETIGYDEIILEFGHESSIGGASKKFSFVTTAPSLYMEKGTEKFSISYLTDVTSNPEIPLAFKPGTNGVYTLSVPSGLEAFERVTLHDLAIGVTRELKQNPVYTFTAAEGDAPNRFKLTFGSVGIETPAGQPIAAYYAAGRLHFVNAQAEKTIEVFNLAGQRIIFAKTTADEYPVNLSAGMYVVKVSTAQQLVSAKFFVK